MTTMQTSNAFETKRAARVERMRDRAATLRAESDREFHKHDALIGVMAGTPVLCGHHSEKRHLRDLDRIHTSAHKSLEMQREAERLESRADAAESNRAVSSDDPNAVEKLQAKLDKLTKFQELMRAVNRVVKSKKLTVDEMVAKCAPLGVNADQVRKLLEPDFCGRIGFADYQMTNNNAEIHRLQKRIEGLQAKAAAGPKAPEAVGEVCIFEEDNRVQMKFPGKPSEAIRKDLHSSGFHWSRGNGVWMRMASEQAWYHARRIAKGA